ncbi:MAG: hypothetical protein QF918_05665 [Pirellulaceae bacterium]|nr:hypothetical protein [Pirellulaceae bacterium]MDP6553228.1 hypothetical protein [Pirellulaceae bacterium]
MATRTRQHKTSTSLGGFVSWVDQARLHLRAICFGSERTRLFRLRDALARATQRELSDSEFIDQYAQAVACGRAATRVANKLNQGAESLLPDVASPLIADSFFDAVTAWPPAVDGDTEPVIAGDAAFLAGLYEPFLGQHHQQRRSRNGVYYTPSELAGYIVRQVDRLLRSEFGLPDGLADIATWADLVVRHPQLCIPKGAAADEPFVRILDPAVGGGVFLVAAIESIYQTMLAKWNSAGWTYAQILQAWQDYVPRHLLPRLCGLELMLPAAVVAHWQVFQMLIKTGYQFQGDECIRIFLIDTLADWNDTDHDSASELFELPAARVACRQELFSVILGNPPFSGISRNNGYWISELLRGRTSDGQKTASYYRANGEPLAERKLWLQDDYVKFLRYAQWKIETAGAGIVGFVTNHGYLDNITFRGMREQLRAAFPRIAVLDLHGSAKKKERAPNGQPDENVFGIESGIAVGVLRKPLVPLEPSVEFSELWGTRDHKLSTLTHGVPPWRKVAPVAPYHFFSPLLNESGLNELAGEYEHGVSLTDVMPVNSTVAVTARDSFVVAFERDELLGRMAMFRDLTIPDDHIRARFFSNSRSTRYAAGDTRGWKLAAARRRMADDPAWQLHVRRCLYRPFDQRWIYWADWMVDWPRTEVNQHLTAVENFALIARRQMLPTHPCNFFWVSRTIPIDGVIRSDNRGSESAFPLFLMTGAADVRLPASLAKDPADTEHCLTANFSDRFIKMLTQTIQLQWQIEPTSSSKVAFGPLDLFHYIYAQFYSVEYRRRYADWLRIDFPRVFVPRTAILFWQLSRLGAALVTAHTAAETVDNDLPKSQTTPQKSIEPGYPKFIADRIQLHDQVVIDEVSEEIWKFCAGGHQVCRKWWRDRRGRVPTATDITNYRQLVDGVRNTIEIISQVDRCIELQGGWPGAFLRT